MHMSMYRLRQCNKLLAGIVVVFGLYVIVQPLLPQVDYFVRHMAIRAWWWEGDSVALPVAGEARALTRFVTPRTSMAAEPHKALVMPVPTENTLIIPDIDVRATILEGTSAQVLLDGIWHRPGTGTPDTGGNTVLVGHRFLYTSGVNTFYHLDKLRVDDPITVYWKGQRYTYIIDSSTVTSANSFEIEQSTVQPVLTLYTCTPLFSIDKRLVVRARLVDSELVALK